jgi:hypothetical protein
VTEENDDAFSLDDIDVDDVHGQVIERYGDAILRLGDPLALEQFVAEEDTLRNALVSSIGQILAIYHAVRAPLVALSESDWVPEDRRSLVVDVVRSLENCVQFRDAKN